MSRMRMTTAWACACLCAAVLAACGGGGHGSSDVAQVRLTIEKALTALANRDGAGWCALATKKAQAELAKTTPGSTCAQVVRRIGSQLSPQVRVGLRHAHVGRVTFRGGRASIRAAQITSSKGTLKGFLQASAPPTDLVHQDGAWKIAP